MGHTPGGSLANLTVVHHSDSSLLLGGKVRPALPPHRLNRRLDCRSGKEEGGAKTDGEYPVRRAACLAGWLAAWLCGWLAGWPVARGGWPERCFEAGQE